MANVTETVQLGDNSYHVAPQRIGRLRRELSDFLASAGDLEIDATDVVGSLGGYAHRLLLIFIPDLMPKWQWDGYASEEEAAQDVYDERLDKSPDPGQIATAFNVAMTLNRFDLFKHLRGVVGDGFLSAWVRTAMAEAMPGPASPTPSSRIDSAAPTGGASSTSGTPESTGPETPTSDSPASE